MTIAANMRIETATDGRQYLVGTLLHALDRGALIHVRKSGDGGYSLVALSGDGRQINHSRETLFSFQPPEVIAKTHSTNRP